MSEVAYLCLIGVAVGGFVAGLIALYVKYRTEEADWWALAWVAVWIWLFWPILYYAVWRVKLFSKK